jgi:hypothetical protein
VKQIPPDTGIFIGKSVYLSGLTCTIIIFMLTDAQRDGKGLLE